MINLSIGQNTVFVTLRERAELTNADILVSLTFRDTTTITKTLKTSDCSLSTDRANAIAIEVVTNEGAEDLLNGKIFLTSGDYEYKIYESDDGTTDVTGKKLLEIGVANFNEDPTASEYDRQIDEKVYNG